MAASITERIAALEQQHRYGCLSDLQLAEAVDAILPEGADDAVRHPFWLSALATEVAQLNAEWKQAQSARHAIPIRCGCILPSRVLAAAFCASSIVGISLFAYFFWPALATLSDGFRAAGWPAWAALVAFLLMPTVLFPVLVYWWATQFERAQTEFQRRRADLIHGALRRSAEGAEPGAAAAGGI